MAPLTRGGVPPWAPAPVPERGLWSTRSALGAVGPWSEQVSQRDRGPPSQRARGTPSARWRTSMAAPVMPTTHVPDEIGWPACWEWVLGLAARMPGSVPPAVARPLSQRVGTQDRTTLPELRALGAQGVREAVAVTQAGGRSAVVGGRREWRAPCPTRLPASLSPWASASIHERCSGHAAGWQLASPAQQPTRSRAGFAPG